MAMRYAFNADKEQFAEFEKSLMPVDVQREIEQKKVKEGFNNLKRLFGG